MVPSHADYAGDARFQQVPVTGEVYGVGRSSHGNILYQAVRFADQNRLKPLLEEQQFGSDDIGNAYDLVANGSRGKVVLELDRRSFLASGLVGLDAFRRKASWFDLNPQSSTPRKDD